MSVMPLECPAKYSPFKWKSFSSLLLPLVLCGSSAWAAAPAVVIDTQQILGTGYNQPQSIAVNNTNQGAIFIADTQNNQIVALVNGYPYAFNPPGFTLVTPQAIALDAKGDLFIGDTPSNNGVSYGRVIEMPADSTGNLTGTAEVFFSGAPLTNPISLAVDGSGTVFIGDYQTSGPSAFTAAIYSSATVGATPTQLSFTGLNPQFTPAALLRDSSNNLYIADNGNGGTYTGGIFVATDTGGPATQVSTQSFTIDQPAGLALDSAGDLFILTLLGSSSDYQVVVVPGASPSTPYIIPSNGMGNTSSMALDANGNLDVMDFVNGQLFQLNYLSPTNFGYLNVGQTGPPVLFNFEFNAPTTLNGFSLVTQGDSSTDLTQASGGTCATGTLPGAISPYTPYSCIGYYEGTPKFPGLRDSAVVVQGASNTTLASASVYEIGLAGAEITYPLTATTTATNLQQPQAVAISGLNNTVYVADTQAGVVYSTSGLGGSTLTPVSTGTISLQAPSALALDAAGDLFIADYNLGEVIKVPNGQAPSVVIPAGGVLQHPIALTVDFLGNLYVGDAGPAGLDASYGNPGYVVKLPVGGTAYKLTLPATLSPPVVFPQALTTDFYTGFLFIGDGGDQSSTGQVVVVTADGSVGGPIALGGVTNPTGLGFDPAGALYVLDGTANTITVDPIYSGATPYLLGFDNSTLAAASAMGMSAGGQSFVIANIGSGSTNLVYLNGNSATLPFGNVQEHTQSQTMTATEYNIGNAALTLASPYYTTATPTSAFNILGSSTCGGNVVLNVGSSCSINVQFAPVFIGYTTQQLTVDSNGYNSGASVLSLNGTGTAGPSIANEKKKQR